VQELAGDVRVADTTSAVPHPYEDGMAASWISTHRGMFESGKGVVFAITLLSSGELVGAIGLDIKQDGRRGVFGYWIGAPYWGNGFCTEALIALISFGFEHYEIDRMYAVHMIRNPASGRVMEKAGLQYEGELREHLLARGKLETVRMYGILRREWEKRRHQWDGRTA
jgi:RimJ/RimL family protein N-acetyltransferase